MTKEIRYCPHCGKSYIVEAYHDIDGAMEPELREKVLGGFFFTSTCPHCKENNFFSYSLTYIDSKHNFEIKLDDYSMLMDYYQKEVKNKKDNVIRVGVSSYSELVSKICMLENNIDYRIGTLYCLCTSVSSESLIKEKIGVDIVHTRGCHFIYDENGQLNIEFLLTYEKNKKKHSEVKRYECPEEDLKIDFNEIKNRCEPIYSKMFDYYFDLDSATKVMRINLDEANQLEEEKIEFAYVRLEEMGEMICSIPHFNEGEFLEGDLVCVMKDQEIKRGTIDAIYNMNALECPVLISSAPVVSYKNYDVSLVTSQDSNAEIENTVLKKSLDDFWNKGASLNVNAINNADVIIGMETSVDPSDFYDVVNGGNMDKVHTHFLKYYFGDDAFLCVYLEQNDKKHKTSSNWIYKFDDVIKLPLNNPTEFKGIIVNPDTDKIVLDNEVLLRYEAEKIMTSASLMKEFLDKLTKDEKAYLGEFRYEVIYKVYNTNTSPKILAKEYNKTDEEIGDALSTGYHRIKHIIWDNYMFKEEGKENGRSN